jgi:hypothetical protein
VDLYHPPKYGLQNGITKIGLWANHTLGKLAAVSLKHLKDGSHADGGNLYLIVRGNIKFWVFRFIASGGKRRRMGLRPFRSVS